MRVLILLLIMSATAFATDPSGPIIFSNDMSASDAAASGLGPTPAITGTCHTGGVSDTVLTMSVAPTGVNVGDLAYVSTGATRKFSVINTVGAMSVTVDDSFMIDSGTPATIAIGGQRATLKHTDSYTLVNSASDGAKNGWVIQLADEFVEPTSGTAFVFLCPAGVTIQGEPGASTQPTITYSATSSPFDIRGGCKLKNLTLSATGVVTNQIVITQLVNGARIEECLITSSTATGSAAHFQRATNLIACEVTNTSGDGVEWSSTADGTRVSLCRIHDCNGTGIFSDTTATVDVVIANSIIADNGGDGLNFSGSSSADAVTRLIGYADSNAFYNNNGGGSGLDRNNINAGSHDQTMTASPFTAPGSADYSINNAAGGGAVLRGATSTIP